MYTQILKKIKFYLPKILSHDSDKNTDKTKIIDF